MSRFAFLQAVCPFRGWSASGKVSVTDPPGVLQHFFSGWVCHSFFGGGGEVVAGAVTLARWVGWGGDVWEGEMYCPFSSRSKAMSLPAICLRKPHPCRHLDILGR